MTDLKAGKFCKNCRHIGYALGASYPRCEKIVAVPFSWDYQPDAYELPMYKPVDGLLVSETKNGDRIAHPILPRFAYLLRHWPMEFGYTYYSRHFRLAREAVGMPDVHLHDLRHSTASALLSGGHGLHQVAQVLGHKTVQSTKRYAHLYPEAQASALASIFRRKA